MVKAVGNLVGKTDGDGYRILFQSGRWTVRKGYGGMYISGDVRRNNRDPLNGSLYEIPPENVQETVKYIWEKTWFDDECELEFYDALDYWVEASGK